MHYSTVVIYYVSNYLFAKILNKAAWYYLLVMSS